MTITDASWRASDIVALVDAHSRYPNHEQGSFYDEVLLEVHAAADYSGSIGKRDIGALMLWKRLNLSTRWTRALNELSDHHVRTITASALELARETTYSIPDAAGLARQALLDFPGCGASSQAVPSTILTACAPERMSVYDTRVVTALKQLRFSRPIGGFWHSPLRQLRQAGHAEHAATADIASRAPQQASAGGLWFRRELCQLPIELAPGHVLRQHTSTNSERSGHAK